MQRHHDCCYNAQSSVMVQLLRMMQVWEILSSGQHFMNLYLQCKKPRGKRLQAKLSRGHSDRKLHSRSLKYPVSAYRGASQPGLHFLRNVAQDTQDTTAVKGSSGPGEKGCKETLVSEKFWKCSESDETIQEKLMLQRGG